MILTCIFLAINRRIRELVAWLDDFQKKEDSGFSTLPPQEQEKMRELFQRLINIDERKFEKDGEGIIREILKMRRKYIKDL